MTQYRTVNLPEDLCAAAEKSLTGRFESLEALLSFLLQEIAKDEAGRLDQAEEQALEQRLRDLGYI
jgi:uncharacterized membrane protein YgcG